MDLRKLLDSYVRFKILSQSLPRVVGGGLLIIASPCAAIVAYVVCNPNELVCTSNLIAFGCGWLALALPACGVRIFFDNLANMLPPRESDAPGRARLANRDDLRRSGII